MRNITAGLIVITAFWRHVRSTANRLAVTDECDRRRIREARAGGRPARRRPTWMRITVPRPGRPTPSGRRSRSRRSTARPNGSFATPGRARLVRMSWSCSVTITSSSSSRRSGRACACCRARRCRSMRNPPRSTTRWLPPIRSRTSRPRSTISIAGCRAKAHSSSVTTRIARRSSSPRIGSRRCSTRRSPRAGAAPQQHIPLPPGESFTVEYVTNKSWSGYNWYQGNYHSLIQVNTDLPIYIDRAVDLACHEGYPGHHVYNALLEKSLVRDRGWVEMTVYPLFSPQSLIAEGSANYGIDVAFPGDERVALRARRAVSGRWPGSGRRRRSTTKCMRVVDRLSYAGNEAARRYLNGEIDRAAAVDVADALRADVAAAGRAADAVHGRLSQLRHQLQPRARIS